jgi:uncharacterized membrane protein
MTDEEKRILQLEQELDKLSSQINAYRQRVDQLKSGSSPKKQEPEEAENFVPVNKKEWEFPSHLPQSTEGGLEKFIGLRLLHFAGIIALVIGLSIGVKYAVDKNLITPAARIMLACAAGIILYILSVRLKKKYVLFSAILLSGSMASLYFTTYAAFAYYNLLNPGLTFALMVCITVFTVYSAIRYNKQEIAILGMIGAYGIPFLISANSGRADLFFIYIIFINCGIAFLAYRKMWKLMTGLALFLSWFLFLGWVISKYDEGAQGLAIAVMIAFYLMFAATTIGSAINKKRNIEFDELLQFLMNSIFAFGAALLVFSNTDMIKGVTGVTAIGSIVFAIQALLAKNLLPKEKLLFNSLTAFSVLCLVFYIGLKWSGMPVTMGWLLTAAGLFTIGVLSKINWFRLLSVIVTGISLVKLLLIDRRILTPEEKIISFIAIGVWMLLLSFFYQRYKKQWLSDTANGIS